MNRPIKFRARSLTMDKRWVYGSYSFTPSTGYHAIFDWDNLVWVAVDGNTVGQLTGLTDKNGDEIYEGDIVKRFTEVNESFGYDLVKVQWNNNRCYWELERANDQASYWGHMNGSHAKEGRYEVIGNIYENHELLDNELKK